MAKRRGSGDKQEEELRKKLESGDVSFIAIQAVTVDPLTGRENRQTIAAQWFVEEEKSGGKGRKGRGGGGGSSGYTRAWYNMSDNRPDPKERKPNARELREKNKQDMLARKDEVKWTKLTEEEKAEYLRQQEEERQQKEERKRQREERIRLQQQKEQEIRDKAPMALQKLPQQVEQLFGYAKLQQQIEQQEAENSVREAELQKQLEQLSREVETLKDICGNPENTEPPLPGKLNILRPELQALVGERFSLLAQLQNIGLFRFGEKKRLQSRLEEVEGKIRYHRDKLQGRKGNIRKEIGDNRLNLDRRKEALKRLNADVEKSLRWRGKAIHIYMEEHPEQYELYERDLLPILELMEKKGRVTMQDILNNHPNKEALSVQILTDYFQSEVFSALWKMKMENGKFYYSIDV